MDSVSLPQLMVAAHESGGPAEESKSFSTQLPMLNNSVAMVKTDLAQIMVQNSRNGKSVKSKEQEYSPKSCGRKKGKGKSHSKSTLDESQETASTSSPRSKLSDSGTDSDSNSDTDSNSDSEMTRSIRKSDAPVIPPRILNSGFKLPEDDREKARWFRILSPRETKGIDGPYSELELRLMYKTGDLNDNTMMWTEGQSDWEQLLFMKNLRPRMLQLPLMPPKVGEDMKAEAYNPITSLPTEMDAMGAKPLESMPMNLNCSRCGSIAVGHMGGVGANQADLTGLRKSLKMKGDGATECIPGLIWCGNSSAAKLSPILDMGFTLIINCTSNLGNPKDKLPYFRCKTVPFKDKPRGAPEGEKAMEGLMDMLEKVYDWMELERISPERALQSDPPQMQSSVLEKTDKFGRSFKTVEEKAIKLRIGKEKRVPRILLWSRKGLDRPCVVAAAYMIRQYGMPMDKALAMLEISRPGLSICRYYKTVLEMWSHKYTLGELLCLDCLNMAKHNHSHTTQNEKLFDNKALINETGEGPEVPEDKTSVQILTKYLDMIPTEADATKITRALGSIEAYLPKLYFGNSIQSGWTGLMDLNLYGVSLGDGMITDLFDAFLVTGVSKKLRSIGLGSTRCGCAGMEAIRRAVCRQDDDGKDYAIAQANASEVFLGGNVTSTSLHIGEVGLDSIVEGDGTEVQVQGDLGPGPGPGNPGNNENTENTTRRQGLGLPSNVPMDDRSVLTMGSAFADATDELISLDLHSNKIGYAGCKELAELFRQVESLTCVNVSYNPLTDLGAKILLDSITPDSSDFAEEEEANPSANVSAKPTQSTLILSHSMAGTNPSCQSAGAKSGVDSAGFTKKDERVNTSITSINLSSCELGHASSEKLLDTFRENLLLTTFICDYNPDLTPKEMKHIMNTIRSYNKTLQCLSLGDMPISVKTCGYITRLLENWATPLMDLDFTKCDFGVPHMRVMCQYIPRSKYLKRFSMGSNTIGTEGAHLLAEAIKNLTPEETEENRLARRQERLDDGVTLREIEEDEVVERMEVKLHGAISGPPLAYINFSHMDLDPAASAELFKAVCTRASIQNCNMSGNDFGDEVEHITPWLEGAHFKDLHLNNCNFGTKGGITILNACCDMRGLGKCVLGSHLLQLDISSNQIHNKAVGAICRILKENMRIEVLDLGFNKLTDDISEIVKTAYGVVSTSRIEEKVYELHINVLGNDCHPYMLGEPGMGRSKSTYRFGINPSMGDDINDGYSHINQTSRAHNFMRKSAFDQKVFENHNLLKPIAHIN